MSIGVSQSQPRLDGRLVVGVLAGVCTLLVIAGLIYERQPVLAAAVLIAVPAGFVTLRRPDSIVPLVLFLIYSNAVVVAVRFHGVPSIAAMLVPAPLAVPLVLRLLIQRQPLTAGPALPWLLALTAWQLLSTLFSSDPERAIDSVLSTVCEGLLMYLLITNVVCTRKTLRHCVWALVAAGAFMGSISVYQQATRSFDSDFGGFGQVSGGPGFKVSEGRGTVQQRRLAGPIGEKNRYAQVMLMLVPLAISRVWAHRQKGLKAIALYAALTIAIGAALTFSRSGAIAFVLMLLAAIPLRFVSRRQIAVLFIGGFIVLLAVPQYRTRLATIPTALGIFGSRTAEEPDGAIRGRATEMLAAARIAIDHPVLCVGPNLSEVFIPEYGQVGGLRALEGRRQAHCMYLEIPAELGFPGLLIFAAMLFATCRRLLQASRLNQSGHDGASQTSSAILLSLIGYLVMGVFLHMSYVRYFWLVLALADAASCIARRSYYSGNPEAVA